MRATRWVTASIAGLALAGVTSIAGAGAAYAHDDVLSDAASGNTVADTNHNGHGHNNGDEGLLEEILGEDIFNVDDDRDNGGHGHDLLSGLL